MATRAASPSTGDAAGRAGEGKKTPQNSNPRSELEKETRHCACLVPSRGEISVPGDVEVSDRAGREENAVGISAQDTPDKPFERGT